MGENMDKSNFYLDVFKKKSILHEVQIAHNFAAIFGKMFVRVSCKSSQKDWKNWSFGIL